MQLREAAEVKVSTNASINTAVAVKLKHLKSKGVEIKFRGTPDVAVAPTNSEIGINPKPTLILTLSSSDEETVKDIDRCLLLHRE
jgi:hypothetical protein